MTVSLSYGTTPLILADGYTMEHLDHARKVLTRLSALA